MIGHTREVKGIAVAPDGDTAVSCAADCTVKLWRVPHAPLEQGDVQQEARPHVEYVGQHAFLGIDYHHQRDCFATCGHAVDIWDAEHSQPIQTFDWGSESVLSIRFNPVRFSMPQRRHLPVAHSCDYLMAGQWYPASRAATRHEAWAKRSAHDANGSC